MILSVRIINPQEVEKLFEEWSKFSATCYNTDIDEEHPDAIGRYCLTSGHYSGSRTRYIEFEITDVPRFVIDQMVRSEVGVVKNVQSFRYVEKCGAQFMMPDEITDNDELVIKYGEALKTIAETYGDIADYVAEKTGSKERGNEQARYLLPMCTLSAVTIGFTIEALIHYCNIRLCTRAEDLHRECAQMMRDETLKLLPELKKYLVPKCQALHWCPESKGCGRERNEEDLLRILSMIDDDLR